MSVLIGGKRKGVQVAARLEVGQHEASRRKFLLHILDGPEGWKRLLRGDPADSDLIQQRLLRAAGVPQLQEEFRLLLLFRFVSRGERQLFQRGTGGRGLLIERGESGEAVEQVVPLQLCGVAEQFLGRTKHPAERQ
jgi:hypothetical protein